MSLAGAVTALVNAVSTAIGAPAKYSALPANAPVRTPAVMGRWVATRPSQLSMTKHVMREHEVTLYVVLGAARDMPNEDTAALSTAQSVLDAVDATNLSGAVQRCDVTNIAPDALQWGDATFYAVAATCSLIEGR